MIVMVVVTLLVQSWIILPLFDRIITPIQPRSPFPPHEPCHLHIDHPSIVTLFDILPL